MANIYNSMLSTLALQHLLLQAGFHAQAEAYCFQAGPVHVRILDAPRLLVRSPSGTYYLAVLSAEHFRQALASLVPPPASLPLQARARGPAKGCYSSLPT